MTSLKIDCSTDSTLYKVLLNINPNNPSGDLAEQIAALSEQVEGLKEIVQTLNTTLNTDVSNLSDSVQTLNKTLNVDITNLKSNIDEVQLQLTTSLDSKVDLDYIYDLNILGVGVIAVNGDYVDQVTAFDVTADSLRESTLAGVPHTPDYPFTGETLLGITISKTIV